MKKIYKTLLIVLCFTAIHQFCLAQNSGIRKLETEEEEKLDRISDNVRLGITPSALLNAYVGIQFNGAFKIKRNIQFVMETGWIVSSSTFNNENTTGFRIRPSIKFYVTEQTDYRLHLSVGYNIRNTTAQRNSPFSSFNGTFIGNLPYTQKRNVHGLVGLFGVDYWISNRIVLDAGIGVGIGRINIQDLNTPQNAIKDTFIFTNDTPGNSLYPLMILNIKFQYILG